MSAPDDGKTPVVTCVIDGHDQLGEGCFWSVEDGAVWWLDVPMPSYIHRYIPATGIHKSWRMPEMVTAMARRADGTLLVASESGLNLFDPADGRLQHLAALEPDRPDNRTNDGAPDPLGRFWIGTMQNNLGPGGAPIPIRGPSGRLWRVEKGEPPVVMVDGISITNGVVWSPDSRRIYYVDSILDTIFSCPFDLTSGTLGPRSVFSDIKGLGTPDGAAVDAEGGLWSARWDGAAVVRFTPDGAVDRVVPIPATLVTSCAFGGPDLTTLYVTTARMGVDAATLHRYPQQGGLFAFDAGVRGLPRPDYAG